METAIDVSGLTAYYGSREVLKNLTLGIPRLMTTVIIGGSGCGKTTLLKHLIGLLKPARGTININDKDITKLNDNALIEFKKKMGVLFQGAALLNSMSLADNVALPLREHTHLKQPIIDIIVRMKLDLVGLTGFGDYYPAQLSGGMKKRAGIARAMAMDPELLFFDEPSAGLDPVTAAGLDDLIIKLHKTFKLTLVVVTHELASIFTIADYVIMLDAGDIIFIGTIEELKTSSNPKVLAFLHRKSEEEPYRPQDYFKIISGS
ncbi:polyamine ABC transporter ATP-binding protein [Candidatus Magnetobacterium bavaricum]|uniref:Polyamine ABC transporter ATP-binding protein n=1 Tax=Candidatus Magnetobacterium bavaricum TaxID=29290 RepID=A0A0F3GKD9_9BACT|nr:polyamine ABC transporter ATP-binding protein [Candidatus Magnetobacterium bavaricum]